MHAGPIRVLRLQAAVALGTLLLVAVLVVRASMAAFVATTDNAGNSWSAGSVDLVDDSDGSVLYDAVDLTPAAPEVRCIAVTYRGSITPASVRFYGAVTGGDGLDDYIDLVVERGSGGAFGDCTGFRATETVYRGALAALPGTFTAGGGSWAPATTPQEVTYRFTATLRSDNAAQGLSTAATFTWEAQA